MQNAFVPKARRPKFDLHLKIIDLNNVPLVSGSSFVKWHLPHSTAAEHRGRTAKCSIKEHKVVYDYDIHVPIRLTVDKNNMLQETYITFEVVQEYGAGAKDQRVVLGYMKLNLAEYVEPSETEGEEAVCRRYLMQDSKINSTLKVTLFMKQLEGDRNFIAPPLKTAPVFGNIAGIMAGEQGESDDVGHIPSLSSKSRENGEMQDLYRRTLAADLTSFDAGELRADLAIEDIFAGGDGWGNKEQSDVQDADMTLKPTLGDENGGSSDTDSRLTDQSKRNMQFFQSAGHRKTHSREGHIHLPPPTSRPGTAHGRGSLDQQARQMEVEAKKMRNKPQQEVDEFDVREDLKSWRLPAVT
ncbi:hypothetical protein NA57DRAFT_72719 [Rhizodiscina lignyota]|uniref:C2 NT-type domain-containing protein n=1 Tax=Rhizodiscina lignyota TaxID=1504668 RepID=A0A9P4MBD4_9PEZI|nr:hypothetical protein NA57DRAFT_72719 [Rhizodiscina lignyota]